MFFSSTCYCFLECSLEMACHVVQCSLPVEMLVLSVYYCHKSDLPSAVKQLEPYRAGDKFAQILLAAC